MMILMMVMIPSDHHDHQAMYRLHWDETGENLGCRSSRYQQRRSDGGNGIHRNSTKKDQLHYRDGLVAEGGKAEELPPAVMKKR